VLSGRGLCDGLITRPEESYRLWCVLVCDLETSTMRRLKLGRVVKAREKKKKLVLNVHRSSCNVCYFCLIVNKIVVFRQITIIVSNIDFHANPSCCFMRTDGRTDRNDDADCRFS
jgi:hypothetical protein